MESMEKLQNDVQALLDIYNALDPVQGPKKFDLEKVKEAVRKMADFIIENKDECEAFKAWMESHQFYTTPASTKFHGNWDSGLCVHSLVVCAQALRFAQAFLLNYKSSPFGKTCTAFDYTAEDVFVAAMAHDFCKANSYKIEFRNTKDINGNWTKKPIFKTKEELRNLGHGNESVLNLLECMPSFLKRRNVLEAISRHMGFSDLTDVEKINYSNFLQNPLVLLIQYADQSAAAWWDC